MPSPAAPTLWSDTGSRGASAAAVWFVRDLYAYVMETNDLTTWNALSHPECVFCQKTAEVVGTNQADGTVVRMGQAVVDVTRVEELNPLSYSVLVDIAEEDSTEVDGQGNQVGTITGETGQMLVVVHRVGPDWQLREGQWFDEDAEVPSAVSTP